MTIQDTTGHEVMTDRHQRTLTGYAAHHYDRECPAAVPVKEIHPYRMPRQRRRGTRRSSAPVPRSRPSRQGAAPPRQSRMRDRGRGEPDRAARTVAEILSAPRGRRTSVVAQRVDERACSVPGVAAPPAPCHCSATSSSWPTGAKRTLTAHGLCGAVGRWRLTGRHIVVPAVDVAATAVPGAPGDDPASIDPRLPHEHFDQACRALLAAERNAPEEIHRTSVRTLITVIAHAPGPRPAGTRA